MVYTEIFLIGIAIIIALWIAAVNVFRRFRFNLNKTLALAAFLSAVEFLILGIHILDIKIDFLPLVMQGRLFLAIALYLMQLLFHLIHIYPDKKVMPIIWFFLITGTPGLVFAVITAFTDFVVLNVTPGAFVSFEFGRFFWIYGALIVFYQISIFYVIIQKFREAATHVLTQDLVHFLGGFVTSSLVMFVFSVFMPLVMGMYDFFFLGIIITGILVLIILNYGVYDFTNLDFKKFYFNLASLIAIFFLLFIPTMIIIDYGMNLPQTDNVTIAGLSVLIIFYLTISAGVFRSRARSIFLINYFKLLTNFRNLFISADQISASEDLSLFWDNLYRNAFEVLQDRYNIFHGNLFIYNKKEGNYIFLYGYGSDISKEIISEGSPLVRCFEIYPMVIEKSMLYSNLIFEKYRDEAVAFFDRYQLELALPFINYDKKIFAFLLLGGLPSFDTDYITGLPQRRIYTRTFISAFEFYRVQFQRELLHGIMLEEIRETQISEHDRMVVTTVKNRIIQKKIEHVPGIRISSFHMDNSIKGGDYIDSIKINSSNVCVFMADLSYSGIESAILGLELFSVLHTQIKYMNNSDAVLNIMNWIISSAQFSGKYAPAYCFFYSTSGQISYCSAAHNPLYLYNPESDEFTPCETKGIPVGADRDFMYEAKTARLKPGHLGILFSRGLTDAMNGRGENFPLDRIKDLIRKNREEQPSVITRMLFQELEGHMGDTRQSNDISAIVFKVQAVAE